MSQRHPDVTVEVCLESVAGVEAADAAGADRVELCANLIEGGTTPSAGTILLARERTDAGLMVMIRPRGGDFLYDDAEFEVMRQDIDVARECGADGVVFGLLDADGRVDVDATAELVQAARPMEVTFHRAFDMSHNLSASLEDLISAGVDRVLTSGGRASVMDALDTLRDLVDQAIGRIVVMPGCGVMEANIREVVEATGAREIHFAAPATVESGMRFRNDQCFMGVPAPPGEYERAITDANRVAAFLMALRG